MSGAMINIAAKEGGSFEAYCAKPAGGSGPGIVMVQEIFGITDWIKQMAERFAEQEYLVIAPDMFWRMDPGFVADPSKPEELEQAFGYLQTVDHEKAVDDIDAALEALKTMPECNGKVGVTGFCLGGTFTYLAAARLNIDGAVAYYGTQIHEYLDEGKQVTCPLQIHMGELDDTFSVEDRNKIHGALIGKPNIAIYMYDDAGHAFANSDRLDAHNLAAAEAAHERSFRLFDKLK
ncbi:MAG: dienelactone hydrolase family protein [Rhodospirillaceae bacterium]|jgi:carboxymethylenebutenolidase|nr:dienelactone hydrolase family protein [Rhodospirillaceae bacterium]MBT4938383.1 dienelactone hydrolase family protein [Rhodospirillaceae bacterium]MBT5939324.1 dienelactone hydrolase family protein [Rhodospirillaceae bacterium]MBT7265509.1 dienelactone hydrolase family protein [Rhodospirillaceae bacterium]